MPPAVRRVGGTAYGEQTYTLGADESLRLDAVNFTIGWAYAGTFVIPTLTVGSSGSAPITEMSASQLQVTGPGLATFTYSGPANLTDDFSVVTPVGVAGYLLHDFGAVPVTSQLTTSWVQPPGLRAAFSQTFLRSPGAVSISAALGNPAVADTSTVTIQLQTGIAAGHYMMLHMSFIDPVGLVVSDFVPPPTVTDSVGGNVLDFSGHPTYGFSTFALQLRDGNYFSSAVEFYRIVNPLSAGDTVTVKLNSFAAEWLSVTAHDITGLTVGNPVGPNAGGNYTGFSGSKAVSPDTTTLAPVPKWLGGVLFNAGYLSDVVGTVNVSLARGGVEIQPLFANAVQGATEYVQAPLPELHLGPFDTITVSSSNGDSTRDSDTISNFNVYGLDE